MERPCQEGVGPARGLRIFRWPSPSGMCGYLACFFFSSRRRHTRLQGDWSSDVCSSDLKEIGARLSNPGPFTDVVALARLDTRLELMAPLRARYERQVATALAALDRKIGRASCRGRVEISVVAVSLKKKKKQTAHKTMKL